MLLQKVSPSLQQVWSKCCKPGCTVKTLCHLVDHQTCPPLPRRAITEAMPSFLECAACRISCRKDEPGLAICRAVRTRFLYSNFNSPSFSPSSSTYQTSILTFFSFCLALLVSLDHPPPSHSTHPCYETLVTFIHSTFREIHNRSSFPHSISLSLRFPSALPPFFTNIMVRAF